MQLEENKDEEVVDINVQPVRFENSLREITSVEEIQPCSVDVSVLEGNSSQFPSKVNHKEDSFIQVKYKKKAKMKSLEIYSHFYKS